MQNRIDSKVQRFLNTHKRQHFFATVAILLSLVVVLGVTISLIKPAISATRLSDGEEINDAILLVGSTNPLYTNSSEKTVSAVTDLANSTYALGIASQFSVFLEGDFIVMEADTEGRVAVGGGIDADGYRTNGNYLIGTGHYVDNPVDSEPESLHVSFSNLGYGYTDAAAGIINSGPIVQVAIPCDDDPYTAGMGPFAFYKDVDYSALNLWGNHKDYMYQYDTQTFMINFPTTFAMLKQRSDIIDTNAATAATTVTIDAATQTVTFDAHASGQVAEVVMFNITEEQWAIISEWEDTVYFNYRNIPSLPSPITGTEVVDGSGTVKSRTWENSYIVVNVQTGADAKIPYAGVQTNISGDSNSGHDISKGGTDVVDGVTYTNPNNKLGCESLLYNFNDATKLKLGSNFQGTILAPNADVTDNKADYGEASDSWCPGHLSGALIAKSFEGYTEFGYRTYTGPITILGTTTSYEISVDKFDTEGNFLPGATLALYECDDAGNLSANPVAEWVSGTSTKVVNVEAGKKYALKEVAAPEGYILTDTIYYFKVTEDAEETIDLTRTQETASYDKSWKLNKVAWKDSPDFDNATIYVTTSDGNVLEYNALQYENGSGSVPYQIKGLSDIENVVILRIVVEGGTEQYIQYYLNDSSNPLTRTKPIVAGTTKIFGATIVTDAVTTTATYKYVPGVKIEYYTNNYFNAISGSQSYSTTNLSNTYYEIGGTQYSGTQLQSSPPSGVEIVSSTVGSETRYFVFYNDEFVTPIIKLGEFDFVNEKQEDVVVGTGEATVTVNKLDQDRKFLSGATLGLYTVDNNGNLSSDPVNSWTSGAQGQTVNIEFDKKYAIKEINPPDGYAGTDDIYYFILQNGTEQLYEIEPEIIENTTTSQLWSGRVSFGDWEGYTTLSSSVMSQVQVGDVIRVYVTDDSSTSGSQACLQNTSWKDIDWSDPYPSVDGKTYADFTVTSDILSTVRNGVVVKGCHATATKVELRRTTTTQSGEEISFNYVPNVVFNVYNDALFSSQNTSLSKTIQLDYNSSTIYNIDNQDMGASQLTDSFLSNRGLAKIEDNGYVFFVSNGSAITPVITSDSLQTFTFVNEKIILGANVTLKKVDFGDNEKTLSNSTIELYEATNNTLIGTYTLGISNIASGLKTPSNYIQESNDGLKPGSYYFKETKVPDGGYLMPEDNTFEFVVNEDGTVTVNSEYLKYSLDDAELSILNKQGLYVEKVWQDIHGNVTDAPVGSEVKIEVYDALGTNAVELYSLMSASDEGGDSETGVNPQAPSTYTLEYILSNYQVFTGGDLISENHMVGALAAGGDLDLYDYEFVNNQHWGNAQIAPSIIGGTLINGSLNSNSWLSDEQKQGIYYNTVYYNESKVDLSNYPNFIQCSNYLDFATVMENVKKESQSLTSGAYEIREDIITPENAYGINSLYTIDLSKTGTNIEIPYELFKKAGGFNFTGVSLEKFATGGYTISITGVNENDINLSFVYTSDSATKIYFNGSQFSNALKNLSGATNGGQVDLSDGMNLVFNFPDATGTITTNYLSGHLVAPGADVVLTGGNFEGSILAATATLQGQGHFYPYNAFGSDSVVSLVPEETYTLNADTDWLVSVPGVGADEYNSGYYYIEEVPVPGYDTSVDYEAKQQEDGTYLVTVTNRKHAYSMPSTGGGGTEKIVTAGIILMSIACIGLVAKRRKAPAKNKTQ